MSDEISTHYVKRGFAVADDVVLATTRTTRTVFHPAMHGLLAVSSGFGPAWRVDGGKIVSLTA